MSKIDWRRGLIEDLVTVDRNTFASRFIYKKTGLSPALWSSV